MDLDRIKASCLAAVFLFLPLTVNAASQVEQQREWFRQAYAQVQAGNFEAVKPLMADLRSYPLYPWLEYAFLSQSVDSAADEALRTFVDSYPNSVMSDGIYARWAKRLAETRDWSALVQYIPENVQPLGVQCYRAEALLAGGQRAQGLEQGKAIWQKAKKELPSDCDGLIAGLQASHALSNEDYWQRIRALIANNHVSAARSLVAYLPEPDGKLVELWADLRASPAKKLPDALALPESARLREIIVDGIKRVADDKLQAALPWWETAQKTFTFTPAEKGEVESRFGMWEAWKQDPAGFKRLNEIPPEYRTVEGNIWLARMAMRQGQWQALLEAATALGQAAGAEAEDERDTWKYWQARALEALGKKAEARSAYNSLAVNATFYGFLAADQLGQRYHLDKPAPDRSQRTQGLQKLAVLRRWQEWMALGDRSQARKEWFRALQDMDKEGVLAAAELAMGQGDANLAIWTVSRTKDWNSVDVRFPLMYEQIVMEQARSQGIRPEWILGIMRRESAFDAGAESSAKALGLMQLMPATARDVGRQLGMQVSAKEDILQPATNVQLGSAYLRDMLRRFSGNYAQATAAYNAGPGRIPKWAPDQTLQADQWVESIPFEETRKYVRAVMAYTTVYDHKLNQGNSTPLSLRLQPINPK